MAKDHYLEVAEKVDHLHMWFSTMFPHESMIKIGGARLFVGLKHWVQIEKLALEVQNWCAFHARSKALISLWTETTRLMRLVNYVGRTGSAEEINRAFKLYFCASALTYLWLKERSESVRLRKTNEYIDGTLEVLAMRSGFTELAGGTVIDAIHRVVEMELEIIP